MKQGHLLVMFIVIYLFCFLALLVEQNKYDITLKEKQRVEQALLDAVYSAARQYEKVINEREEIRKSTVSDIFLESFYVSMGLFGSNEEQEYLRMYLPLLILAEEDGAFFFSMQKVKTEEEVELHHVWSDKIQYEDTGEYAMLNTIEKMASSFTAKHNFIAEQYGISYQFHAPSFLEEISGEAKLPMLFVVFQGWPLSAAGDVIYENCIDAGVYITEKTLYTVLGPEDISEPYYVYHSPDCELALEEGHNCIYNVSHEEAINKFGAYPCNRCINSIFK